MDGKAIVKSNKRELSYFVEKKEEIGRGCFELKLFGEKLEFRVMAISH